MAGVYVSTWRQHKWWHLQAVKLQCVVENLLVKYELVRINSEEMDFHLSIFLYFYTFWWKLKIFPEFSLIHISPDIIVYFSGQSWAKKIPNFAQYTGLKNITAKFNFLFFFFFLPKLDHNNFVAIWSMERVNEWR